MKDPSFAAFVSAAGLQEELALADAARRRESINRALGIQTEEISAQGQQARKQIRGQQEVSGALRSGQTLERLADQEASEARLQSAAQLDAATRIGDIQSGLATQSAGTQFDIFGKALETLPGVLESQAGDVRGQALNSLTGIAPVPEATPLPKPKKPTGGGGAGIFKHTQAF